MSIEHSGEYWLTIDGDTNVRVSDARGPKPTLTPWIEQWHHENEIKVLNDLRVLVKIAEPAKPVRIRLTMYAALLGEGQ